MPVIPLQRNRNLVTTHEAFQLSQATEGPCILISNFDESQLCDGSVNTSYDLRVGAQYRDHREPGARTLAEGGAITLYPGAAVIIKTEEYVYLPRTMFGYIVPKVGMLKRGLSNTMSKVDPGYHGRLLVTLFNLGKQEVKLNRGEQFCALTIHRVEVGGKLYDGQEKDLQEGETKPLWHRLLDWIGAHQPIITLIIFVVLAILLVRTYSSR